MLKLSDVRDYISKCVSSVADDENVYSGKLDDKKDKSIGVYNQKRGNTKLAAVGAEISYSVKSISVLVHWNKSQRETEAAAMSVYELIEQSSGYIGGKEVKYIKMSHEEPVDVQTDDNGIYEMVIEFDIYYERQVINE